MRPARLLLAATLAATLTVAPAFADTGRAARPPEAELASAGRGPGRSPGSNDAALLAKLDRHHADTGRHVRNVGEYAAFLAARIGLPALEVEEARRAGRLHDIGKLDVPVAILDKPGKLTGAEWLVIKRHPRRGAELAEADGVPHTVAIGPAHHHERWDGTGYPAGLKGEAIPRVGRIVSVADTWDAMTTKRSYQPAKEFGTARSLLQKAAGTQLDPALVDAFLRDEKALKALHGRLSGGVR